MSRKLTKLVSDLNNMQDVHFCIDISLKIENASTSSQDLYLKIHADSSTHELTVKSLEINYK